MKYPKTNYVKRLNFSMILLDGYYRVQCDETKELVSGKIHSKKRVEKLLRDHVNTNRFVNSSRDMPKEEIIRKVKIFGGRLRPKKKPWTLEEAKLVASIYETRGELYTQNQRLYSSAYAKGWLDEICTHMTPSRKKNKYVYGVLNPNKALAKIWDYDTHLDFTKANMGAYDALRRYGIDTPELFENRDNSEYLKMIIRKLANESAEEFVR